MQFSENSKKKINRKQNKLFKYYLLITVISKSREYAIRKPKIIVTKDSKLRTWIKHCGQILEIK